VRGTLRPVLVVLRGWPQQENPALPLLPADAPAVLAGRVATAAAQLPPDVGSLLTQIAARAADLGLTLPADAALTGVCEHALRAGGDVAGSLRLVAADVGDATLVYALLTPFPLAERAERS
jgi:hypothetical protein